MSWNACMVIDTGGDEPAVVEEIRNITYNNSKIFTALGIHPNDIKGKLGSKVASTIEKALRESHNPKRERELLALEPENKWGGLDDVRDFLGKAVTACKKHPKAFLSFI